MSLKRCVYCLALDHTEVACPEFRAAQTATQHGIIDPMHAEDEQDQLAMRNFALRAALRGVLVEAKRIGLVFTPETASLISAADSFDP